jgi:hypothetical protein
MINHHGTFISAFLGMNLFGKSLPNQRAPDGDLHHSSRQKVRNAWQRPMVIIITDMKEAIWWIWFNASEESALKSQRIKNYRMPSKISFGKSVRLWICRNGTRIVRVDGSTWGTESKKICQHGSNWEIEMSLYEFWKGFVMKERRQWNDFPGERRMQSSDSRVMDWRT